MTLPDLPRTVKVVEVGPRDGLQNQPEAIPTDLKVRFIMALAEAGLTQIEATSFVHPEAVPQLADALDLVRRLPKNEAVVFSALVPNLKGLDQALEAGIRRVAVFTAASDAFTQHNIRMTIRESLDTFRPVVERALANGISVRGYVSTAFVCPYAGKVSREKAREVTDALLALGVDEVSLGDTIGAATPKAVFDTVEYVLAGVPREKIALHFHDTYGTALVNVYAGLQLGITTFDSSAGGLGGCPYAPGASGNLATEDLIYLLDGLGIETGVHLEKVAQASNLIAAHLDRPLPSRQLQRLNAGR